MKPERELEIMEHARTDWLQGLLDRLALLYIQNADEEQQSEALADLAQAIANANGVADLLGRRRLALEINAAMGKRIFQVPAVPFEEAIDDILKRHPEIAPGWEATRDAYLDGGFAIARSSQQHVTEHVQRSITSAMRGGMTGQDAVDEILRAIKAQGTDDPVAKNWTYTGGYAETVYRTNIASSYTAGRVEQAKDPVFRRQVAAWEFTTYPGRGVRPNHAAMHGLIAGTDDPIWDTMRPPLGYNCRCSLEFVGHDQALRRGAIGEDGAYIPRQVPAGAFPDTGFKT